MKFFKLKLVLILLVGIYSCNSTDNTEKSGSLNNNLAKPDTTSGEILTDTSIQLEIISDTAYFKKGKYILAKSYILPLKKNVCENGEVKTIRDEAFLIANCMIILRNIKTAGEFCHIPEIEKAEIYNDSGEMILIEKDKKQTISGATLTEVFNGNRYESPAKKWGMIFNEAEGMIFGFMIIRSDGSYIYTEMGNEYSLSYGEKINTRFDNNDKFVFYDCLNDNNVADLIIYPSGKFELINK